MKNSKLTQLQLDKYIISALGQMDTQIDAESGGLSGIGLQMYYSGTTVNDFKRERQEILSTTVKDIKSYVPVITKLLLEDHKFVKASSSMLKSSDTKFKQIIDLKALKK